MGIAHKEIRVHYEVAGKREMRKQLKVSKLDPFTLLEVVHTLREIPCGESLELIVKADCDTEDLFRILAPDKFRIDPQPFKITAENVHFLIDKLTDSPPWGGTCCS